MTDESSRGRRDRRHSTHSSTCPVAKALNIVGDRWTLLLVRDLMYRGPLRFTDFLKSPTGERISTNMLSARLEELQIAGLVAHVPDPKGGRRKRYALTPKGEALSPVVLDLANWAMDHMDGAQLHPEFVEAMALSAH